MSDKWEIYKDADDKWRWRRTAANGNIVGAATDGYANRLDCEGNARRNGFSDDLQAQEGADKTLQKELSEEKREIKKKAYALYKEHGFKDGNDFVVWLEVERLAGEKSRLRGNKETKGILFTIGGILGVILVLLLIMMFTRKPDAALAQQPAPEVRVMLVVLDPKEDETVVAFGDAHFGYNKSILSPEAKTLLDKDVQSLKENPKIDVRMAGYTSAEGTEAINQKLSEDRANAVRNYLIEKGIAPERITVIGYGRTRPAVYEVTPANINSKQALANMRVLFEVVVK